MSDTQAEGLFVGSRCLAGPSGSWGPATVRYLFADGTAQVEYDKKDMTVLPYWYGVTASELSFHDGRVWPAVFAELSPGGGPMDLEGFAVALRRLGYTADMDVVRPYWAKFCADFLGLTADATAASLDVPSAYALFLRLPQSARSVRDMLHPPPAPLVKFYWNQTRMGGRDPADLPRPVTLADAYAALGVDATAEDADAVADVGRFEADSGVRLPDTVRQFVTRTGIAKAVSDSHPNNPWFAKVGGLELLTGERLAGAGGTFGVSLLNQHGYEWTAVFDAGDTDARIWLANDDRWGFVAPSLPLFFWDLAQTGLGWYQESNFRGGKPVTTNELGYVLA